MCWHRWSWGVEASPVDEARHLKDPYLKGIAQLDTVSQPTVEAYDGAFGGSPAQVGWLMCGELFRSRNTLA